MGIFFMSYLFEQSILGFMIAIWRGGGGLHAHIMPPLSSRVLLSLVNLPQFPQDHPTEDVILSLVEVSQDPVIALRCLF